MQYFGVFVFSLFLSAGAFAASEITMKSDESAESFIKRATKHKLILDESGHAQLAKTSDLTKGSEAFVAITESDPEKDPADADVNSFDLNILVKKIDQTYSLFSPVIACEIEGGTPTLRAFFFVNIAGETNREVGVICGWDIDHPYADCESNDVVYLFKVGSGQIEPVDMKRYKSILYREAKPEKNSDFECTYSKFKTVSDVKKLLSSAPSK